MRRVVLLCRIGGKSNSGEGGEDPERWETLQGTSAEGMNDSLPHLKGLQDGDIATSKIKQVCSHSCKVRLSLLRTLGLFRSTCSSPSGLRTFKIGKNLDISSMATGGIRPIRRHTALPSELRPAGDQDCTGSQAR